MTRVLAIDPGNTHSGYALIDATTCQPLEVGKTLNDHLIDKLLVDGLVNLFGWLPRGLGGVLRPSQSGLLHNYAVGMAGGIALLLLIVLLVTRS